MALATANHRHLSKLSGTEGAVFPLSLCLSVCIYVLCTSGALNTHVFCLEVFMLHIKKIVPSFMLYTL